MFALLGVALVTLLRACACNMTISHGTLNGLIFYANVVSISGLTSLRNCSIHPILAVFVAWVNLEFGVETCFFFGQGHLSEELAAVYLPTLHLAAGRNHHRS